MATTEWKMEGVNGLNRLGELEEEKEYRKFTEANKATLIAEKLTRVSEMNETDDLLIENFFCLTVFFLNFIFCN